MTLAPGTRLGPYEIIDSIGAGGMGEVYRAHDARLGRDVAVKILPSIFLNDPDRLQRFEHEARAAGALNHPNILAVYDVGSIDGMPYVVSELLEGESLRLRLARGATGHAQATEWAGHIARGLAAAHNKGLVHRDIKPENLFVTRDKRRQVGLCPRRPYHPMGAGSPTRRPRTDALMSTSKASRRQVGVRCYPRRRCAAALASRPDGTLLCVAGRRPVGGAGRSRAGAKLAPHPVRLFKPALNNSQGNNIRGFRFIYTPPLYDVAPDGRFLVAIAQPEEQDREPVIVSLPATPR